MKYYLSSQLMGGFEPLTKGRKDDQTGEQRGGKYVARVQTGVEKDGSPKYRYFRSQDEYESYLEGSGKKKQQQAKQKKQSERLKTATKKEQRSSRYKQETSESRKKGEQSQKEHADSDSKKKKEEKQKKKEKTPLLKSVSLYLGDEVL